MYNNGAGLKKKLLEELKWDYRCSHCGLSTYSNFNVTNVPIPLEVEHINGNHTDNRIDNICLLCPNCHALTDTYKGKNMAIAKQNKENPKQKNSKPKQMKAQALFIILFTCCLSLLNAQEKPLQIIMIGAHPDDCDIKSGGTAALFIAMGHHVKFLSVTNGNKKSCSTSTFNVTVIRMCTYHNNLKRFFLCI